MEQKMFLRSYCLIGMGGIEGFKEDLSYITESNINYVSGNEMIIVTFKTTFKIGELEEYLNMNVQKALFGGMIDNSSRNTFTIEDGIKEFMDSVKEDLEYEDLKWVKEERIKVSTPSVDDILDKIGEVGMDKLSDSEKNILNNYSKTKK